MLTVTAWTVNRVHNSVISCYSECVDAVLGTATTSIYIDLVSRSWCLQSTSLPKEVAEQLDNMFEHKPLGAAADTIKHQYKKLQKWQAKVGQNEPNQEMDSVVRRQVVLYLPLL